MHERRERPFTPPLSDGTALWKIALVIIGLGFALFMVYEKVVMPRKPAQRASPSAVAEPRSLPPPPTQAPAGLPPAVEPPSWKRCEMAGRTLYTDSTCPLDATITYAAPPATRHSERTTQSTTLYHCKSYDGRTFWSNQHCNLQRALVDRLVNVPAGLSFDQQVAIADGQRLAALAQANRRAAAPVAVPPVAGADRIASCRALDEQVRQLDAWARQPQSAQGQDWIRSERQKARDEQFRLGC